jgi:HAD superfamily hydrolase (TIGR01509 family)
MIRAVCFDFDGLILDTEYPEFLSWQEVFEAHGCCLSLQTWAEHVGKGTQNNSFSPYDRLDALLGRSLDRDAIRTVRRKRFADLMATQQLLPGVWARLQEARQLGWKVAIVSSSPREWVVGYLTRFGLIASFDAILCGDEVRIPKPDPELYLKALSALELQPDQAVALEDSAHGVAAAKAAGLFCVAIPNSVTCLSCFDHADLTLSSLAEMTFEELLVHVHQFRPVSNL